LYHLASLTNHNDSPVRQRPLSQPCTRTETNAILTNAHHRQFGTTTDDAKLLSSTTKPNVSPSSSSCLNTSHRSDISLRSITKYENMPNELIRTIILLFLVNNTMKWNRLLKPYLHECPAVFVNVTHCSNGAVKN